MSETTGRIVRLLDPHEPGDRDADGTPRPEILPFLAGDAKGDLVLSRKKKYPRPPKRSKR